jgi:hypothetical protein
MKRFYILPLLLALQRLAALDLWQYPESAEPWSLFLDVKAAAFSFTEGFSTFSPEFSADFLLPFGIPLSAGVFAVMPDPNLKNFGIRAGYHINPGDEKTDLYVLYVFDVGFIRNDLLTEYNDTPVPRRYWDFRIGVRRLIGKYVALVIESAYKFQGITAGLSLKLH